MNVKVFIYEIGIPEFKAVIGRNGNRLIFLTIIFLVSLLVLGVANSSKELLKTKMKSPFIKFIDVNKPALPIKGKLDINNESAKALVNDSSLSLSSDFSKGLTQRYSFEINDIKKEPLGMLISSEDKFFSNLISKKKNSLISDKNLFSDDGFGLILTKSFFEDFGILDDAWRDYAFVDIEIKNTVVKLPIAAVVKELRNNCKFAFSKNFLNCVYSTPEIFKKDYQLYNGNKTFFLPNVSELPTDIDSVFEEVRVTHKLSSNCYKKGIMIKCYDTNFVAPNNAIEILDIRKNLKIEEKFIIDYFTFYLEDLSNIDLFAETIKDKFGVEIEKSKMQEKNNIYFFDKITNLLSTTLMYFALFSIILFIVNILISHLNTNKKSLGTLKAFGLSNTLILSLYSGITLFLIVVSFSIAYVSTQLIGQWVTNKFLNSTGFENAVYNNLDLTTLLLSMVAVPTVVILFRVFKFLHNVTPGDLIYERN